MDYIYTELIDNEFKMDWNFEFDNQMIYTTATFDTGCAHSFVSANCIYGHDITKEYKTQLKLQAIKSKNVRLTIGCGVESKSDEKAKEFEEIKLIILKRNKDIASLTQDDIDKLLNCQNIKALYKIKKSVLAGYKLDDSSIMVSYDFDNVVLVGMNIIKNLYTIIGTKGSHTMLFAKFRYMNGLDTLFNEAKSNFNAIPNSEDECYIELNNFQTLQANYVNTADTAKLEGKEEAYLAIAENVLTSNKNKGKQLSKKQAIKYLTEILLIPEAIAIQAYNNCANS